MTDSLHAYLVDISVNETDVMRRLRETTASMPMARMQISPEQGALMSWLAGLLGVSRAIEIGTFTGYSALAVAAVLPEDGKLVCCDVSEEYTSVGKPFWEEAGVAKKIDLRLAPAADTLAALIDEGGAGTYDFAFIDADKSGYDTYYEHCLTLLRSGGVIAVDNVLWGGAVADPDNTEDSTVALRALNTKIKSDPRVAAVMLPIGDGLTLARKRG
ncbi:MAG: class I SAM-dependent methyltransferase [Sandaracinaceae bacterium]